MQEQETLPLRYHVLLSLLVTVLTVAFFLTPWGNAVSRFGYDYLFALRGELGTPEELVIVAIDENSFGEIDAPWPWPRSIHAALTRALFEHGAKAVAFDLLFSEPSQDPSQDQQLADVVSEFPNVVFVSHVETGYNEIGFLQDIIVEPESIREKVATPIKMGFDNVHIDPDGSIRRLFLIQKGETAFGAKAGEAYLGDGSSFGAKVSEEELAWINFLGPRGTIETVSYYQALQPSEYLPEGFFQDRLVFIGRAVSSQVDADNPAVDHFSVPYSRFHGGLMPGVEIHANITFNTLSDIFIRPVSALRVTILTALLGIPFGVIMLRARLVIAIVLFGVATMGILGVAVYLFSESFIYFDYLQVSLPLVGALVLNPVTNYFVVRKQRNFIRKAFSTYLAPSLVEKLISQPGKLELGGEVVEGTVLFLDMAGFTELSEKLPAKELVEMLNRNLGRFAEIVLRYDGMIDKYIGDCIMAVWGVPLPQGDHAQRCCNAVLDIFAEMAILAQREHELTGANLSVRIGANCGSMVAGNVGGGQQFDYTVLGNSVNLASRLEGINKFYGTNLIVSHSVVEQVGTTFEFREIDSIRVVGQKVPVSIYELLSREGALDPTMAQVRERYAIALAAYRARSWREAQVQFQSILELRPGDGPSEVFIERCEEYLREPPPEPWDTVYQMKAK